MNNNLLPYLDFAVETAYLAGRLTMGYFHAGVSVEWKADQSPVTQADRQAETLIRSRIEKAYPNHAILGEEFGSEGNTGASHRWIIDPIDGTKSFIHGVPLFGVLIGLEIDGQVEVGVAYFPALDEMVSGASGLGTWLNGRRAQVSPVSSLQKSVASFTSLDGFERSGRWETLRRLQRATYYQTGWSDAYGYALVATGRVELMLDPIMNVWDCGPFPPILREAGGYFGNWRGQDTIYGNEALATSQVLLPEVLQLLSGL